MCVSSEKCYQYSENDNMINNILAIYYFPFHRSFFLGFFEDGNNRNMKSGEWLLGLYCYTNFLFTFLYVNTSHYGYDQRKSIEYPITMRYCLIQFLSVHVSGASNELHFLYKPKISVLIYLFLKLASWKRCYTKDYAKISIQRSFLIFADSIMKLYYSMKNE